MPEKEPQIVFTSSESKGETPVGKKVSLRIGVSNHGGTAHAAIVDLEVKDAVGNKVFQRFTMGQKLVGGRSKSYPLEWSPTTAGHFTIDCGVFVKGWSEKISYREKVVQIDVKN